MGSGLNFLDRKNGKWQVQKPNSFFSKSGQSHDFFLCSLIIRKNNSLLHPLFLFIPSRRPKYLCLSVAGFSFILPMQVSPSRFGTEAYTNRTIFAFKKKLKTKKFHFTLLTTCQLFLFYFWFCLGVGGSEDTLIC